MSRAGSGAQSSKTSGRRHGCARHPSLLDGDIDVDGDVNVAVVLDADSLDLVELVMALEEEFGIEVPEEELEGIETVGQAYDLVAGKL